MSCVCDIVIIYISISCPSALIGSFTFVSSSLKEEFSLDVDDAFSKIVFNLRDGRTHVISLQCQLLKSLNIYQYSISNRYFTVNHYEIEFKRAVPLLRFFADSPAFSVSRLGYSPYILIMLSSLLLVHILFNTFVLLLHHNTSTFDRFVRVSRFQARRKIT